VLLLNEVQRLERELAAVRKQMAELAAQLDGANAKR